MDFSNKVIIITGASSGIGAKAGGKVALVGRNELQLNSVADKIKHNGSSTPFVIVADVTKDAIKIIDQTIQHFFQLDILVNNAGIARMDNVRTIDFDQYDNMFATNCHAPVELAELAIPYLEKIKRKI